MLHIKYPQNKVEDLMVFKAELESNRCLLENLEFDISNSDWVWTITLTGKLLSSVLETIQ